MVATAMSLSTSGLPNNTIYVHSNVVRPKNTNAKTEHKYVHKI